MAKAARLPKGGDCYQKNGSVFLWELDNPNALLVHGEVMGQGPLEGIKFGHCWIEAGSVVFDRSNGREIAVPKDLYYAIGQIGGNVHKYTLEQVREKVTKTKKWGPWDLKTSSGL